MLALLIWLLTIEEHKTYSDGSEIGSGETTAEIAVEKKLDQKEGCT